MRRTRLFRLNTLLANRRSQTQARKDAPTADAIEQLAEQLQATLPAVARQTRPFMKVELEMH